MESEPRKVCTLCGPLFSSPPFVLRDCRASETRVRVKITPREKRRHAAGREKNFSLSPQRRISLTLLSVKKNGGLLVVYNLDPRVRFSFGHRGQSC